MTQKEKREFPDPPHLSERAKVFYDLLMFLLSDQQGFNEADTLLLVILARAYADYRESAQELDEQGLFYKTSEMKRVSPAFAVLKESEKTIRDLSDRFGLSPKSRERMMKFGNFKKEPDALDLI